MGAKSTYTSGLEHDIFRAHDDEHNGFTFQLGNPPNQTIHANTTTADGRLTPSKQASGLNNTINRRVSAVLAQCPFSAHKIEAESILT